jgi:hypothetical protein
LTTLPSIDILFFGSEPASIADNAPYTGTFAERQTVIAGTSIPSTYFTQTYNGVSAAAQYLWTSFVQATPQTIWFYVIAQSAFTASATTGLALTTRIVCP